MVIYQIFTRLFGNTKTVNIPWGTREQNGVGKFCDITSQALKEIKNLGVTHIWYTGIHHHALVGDYSKYGISDDHPSIVKGRAGSPYAIKDYYQVDPDLAVDPKNRLEEFEQLIRRTHQCGLKVIIDIVPNHIARNYQGLNNPPEVFDFGEKDDTSAEYSKNNNFYYIPETSFHAPDIPPEYMPLIHETGSDKTPFKEFPAKWTGNGSRSAKPRFDDWYETVKINYGIRPDGIKDFPELPDGFEYETCQAHYQFWQGKNVPDSWNKLKDIVLFWLDKGVDGFRYDIAELVPVEFWSFLNSAIKTKYPDTVLIAEIYQPGIYRDFIRLGKMDYLYDKVDMYKTLRALIRQEKNTEEIAEVRKKYTDIDQHLLCFLENHDEQRIASPEFAGDAERAKPALLLSATISSAPILIYFGQEVGEPGKEKAGFGQPSRTSIFDYIGVPNHQRWMNNGKFDGGQLSEKEQLLRAFYQSVLNYSSTSPVSDGQYIDLWSQVSEQITQGKEDLFLFIRIKEEKRALIATNFSHANHYVNRISLPQNIIKELKLHDGSYRLNERIAGELSQEIKITKGTGDILIDLPPLAAYVFEF